MTIGISKSDAAVTALPVVNEAREYSGPVSGEERSNPNILTPKC